MTSSEVRKRVYEVITDAFAVPVEELNDSTTFVDGLGADFLDMIEMVFEIEEAFEGITIDEKEQAKVVMVGQLVELVCNKVKVKIGS